MAQPVARILGQVVGHSDPTATTPPTEPVALRAPAFGGIGAASRATDEQGWALADARLDDPAGLARDLGLDPDACPATLILAGYRRWGDEVTRHLDGDFAFAVWDHRVRRLILGRDRLGVRGLAWWSDGSQRVVASDPALLLQLPAARDTIDPARVAAFLVDGWHDEERSFFEAVHYLPPATTVSFSDDDEAHTRVWRPAVDPWVDDDDNATDEAVIACFARRTARAVERRLPEGQPIALSLSGGLDSSLIAHLTVDALGDDRGRLTAYGYVFDHLTVCDERRFAAPLCQQLDIVHRTIPADDLWALRDIDTWPLDPAFVVADPYARLSLSVADAAAEDGHHHLLTGHFGDMLHVGANGWRSALLARGRVGRWLRALLRQPPLAAVRAARSDVLRLLPPQPASLLRRWTGHRRSPIHDALGQTVTEQAAALRGLPDAARLAPTFGHWLRQHTLLHPSLAQGAMSARGFYRRRGIERLDPFWDPALISLALTAPASSVGSASRPRRMVSEVLAQAGHTTLAARRDKANFHPVLLRGLRREQAVVDDLLHEPRIVDRGWVRPDWLHRQRDSSTWQDGGYLLWKCLSLELWLRHIES